MSNEQEKSQIERTVFADFVRLSGLAIDLSSIEKRMPPEPDLLCRFADGRSVAFELVELCDPQLAQALGDPVPDEGGVQYIRTSDPSQSIMFRKLRKAYRSTFPIELLCYTAGRIITPPNTILPRIRPLLASLTHTFQRAWLLAEQRVYEVWS